MQYCSLQHQILLPSPVTSTTGCCFCFGSISSFFLELFLHWSPVAYWAPTNRGSSSFSVISFCIFILFMGFSRQEYWSGLPFPSPIDHIGDYSHEIKRCLLLGRKVMTNLDRILKCRDFMSTKVCLVKAMVFPVVMYGCWELDHNESWAPKNWCFWTVVLEKTLENPLDCKKIQPKGDSWESLGLQEDPS